MFNGEDVTIEEKHYNIIVKKCYDLLNLSYGPLTP